MGCLKIFWVNVYKARSVFLISFVSVKKRRKNIHKDFPEWFLELRLQQKIMVGGKLCWGKGTVENCIINGVKPLKDAFLGLISQCTISIASTPGLYFIQILTDDNIDYLNLLPWWAWRLLFHEFGGGVGTRRFICPRFVLSIRRFIITFSFNLSVTLLLLAVFALNL